MNTGSCLDSWSIRATLFESLETLFLFGLKQEFRRAKQEISSISVTDFGWVNRHDFWTRVIGSLIGTYLLSGDSFFLQKAVEYSEPLLHFFEIPYPVFLDLHCPKLATKSPGIGTSLSDCAAGFPELAALANLTGNHKYLDVLDAMTENLPRPIANIYRDFYHAKRLSAGTDEHITGQRIPFFANIGLAKMLTGRSEYESVLSNLVIYSLGEENISALIPLLLIYPELPRIPFFAETPVRTLTDAMDKYYFEPPEFIPTVTVMRSLEQDGLIPLLCWRNNGPGSAGKWESALMEMLGEVPPGGIPSGKRTTSERRALPDGILHSEFFALWMKAAALIGSNDVRLRQAVFNEAGHFLAL
jgi:hypothetical protein